jgi:hypothetical protein
MRKHRLTTLTTPETWGKHHLPPYSIFCAWPDGQHTNVILYHGSQVGVLKFSKIGSPAPLEAHNFVCRLSIELKSKAKL